MSQQYGRGERVPGDVGGQVFLCPYKATDTFQQAVVCLLAEPGQTISVFLQYGHRRRQDGRVVFRSGLDSLLVYIVPSVYGHNVMGKVEGVHVCMGQPGITAEHEQVTGLAEAFVRKVERSDSGQFLLVQRLLRFVFSTVSLETYIRRFFDYTQGDRFVDVRLQSLMVVVDGRLLPVRILLP